MIFSAGVWGLQIQAGVLRPQISSHLTGWGHGLHPDPLGAGKILKEPEVDPVEEFWPLTMKLPQPGEFCMVMIMFVLMPVLVVVPVGIAMPVALFMFMAIPMPMSMLMIEIKIRTDLGSHQPATGGRGQGEKFFALGQQVFGLADGLALFVGSGLVLKAHQVEAGADHVDDQQRIFRNQVDFRQSVDMCPQPAAMVMIVAMVVAVAVMVMGMVAMAGGLFMVALGVVMGDHRLGLEQQQADRQPQHLPQKKFFSFPFVGNKHVGITFWNQNIPRNLQAV